ncbi:hypothetical protein [Streptomyces europaeiscabiei]|uniref:hypothetical protein n=1 Tax=Streptomyces europaeiscabiei TaxID=146819 RepID=UPI002E12E4E3|nr:hypothetical protein OHB30_50355 [Streptomyces europaeiscabiei]
MKPDDPEYHGWLEARLVLKATEMRQKIAAKATDANDRRIRRTHSMRTVVRRED